MKPFKSIVFVLLLMVVHFPAKAMDSLMNKQRLEEDSLRFVEMLDEINDLIGVNSSKALDIAQKALELAHQTNNVKQEAFISLSLGKIEFYSGKYEKATKRYSKALATGKRTGDTLLLAKSYFHLGGVRLVLEDYELAEKYYDKAKYFFLEHYGDEQSLVLGDRLSFHNNYGVIYLGLGRLEDAIGEFSTGIALAESRKEYSPIYIQLLHNLGDAYLRTANFKASIEYFVCAERQLGESTNKLFRAMVLNGLGKAYMETGAYNKAIAKYKRGLDLAESVNGLSHIHHLSNGLSKAYEAIGHKDSALIFMKQSRMYEDSLKLKVAAEKMLKEELTELHQKSILDLKGFYQNKTKYFYALGILLLAVGIFFMVRNQIQRLKIKNIVAHADQIKGNLNQLSIQNKSLERQMEDIRKDLVMDTLKSIRFQQVAQEVSHKTKKIDDISEKELKTFYKSLDRQLSKGGIKNIMDDFELRFKNVHEGFFDKLKELFPDLTLNERRLCAFLKLQMTTKEISAITGQTIRAIDIARTRLRKKLKINNTNISLTEFFMDF